MAATLSAGVNSLILKLDQPYDTIRTSKDIDGTIYPSSGIIVDTGYSNFKTSPQPTFQWKKDNVNISGATNFSYTVPASDYADGSTTHTYSCVVSGLDLSGAAKSITSSTTIPLISDGVRGPRTANGYLYYQTAVATDPGTPTATNYNFTTGQFATLTAGWGYTPISASTTNTSLKGWVCRFVVIEPSYGVATGNATVSANSTSITFDGIVTFSNYASGVLTATSVGTGGTTQIDGARITTGTINAARLNLTGYLQVGTAASDINSSGVDVNGNRISTGINGGNITTGSINANRLTVGQTTGVDRIRLYDNKIEIWANNGSGTSVRRVVLGDLS